MEKFVHNDGRGAILDVRENSHDARSCRLRASVRGRSSPLTERPCCDPSCQRRAEKQMLCDLRLTARFALW